MTSRLIRFIGLVCVMAAIGAAIAYVSHRVDTLGVQLEDSRADNTSLRSDLNEQEAASTALAEQVKRLGGKPVVDPPATPAQGERGPGPTAAQVKAAVADYCAGDRCKPTVSRSQVADAVADYCAGGRCLAKDGTDGGPGQDGTDGADGADGAGPTDEQIAAAVAAYCDGGGNCGEDGADGQDGEDGSDGKDATITPSGTDCPDGERVSGVHLLADGSLTVSCAPLLSR